MFNVILAFFKTGLPIGNLSRMLTITLLITSLSLGILLAMTAGERNVAVSNLENAASLIKQKDKTIQDKDQQIITKETEASGCLGKIEELNKTIADNALLAAESDSKGQDRAAAKLDTLPAMINNDRQAAATPEITTRWLQEMFK